MASDPVSNGNVPELLPARMLDEFVYCPRLFYLEFVQGEWAESADTLEGSYRHKMVEKEKGILPAAGEIDEGMNINARSVLLSSEKAGLIAKIDLLEGDGSKVSPVDYKRGKKPSIPDGAYEPERVQICAQGLVLRDNGYQCDEGVIYFVGSRERVQIPLTDELIARTKSLLTELRNVAMAGIIPTPLVDSPKCPRCSLAGICLPDELQFLSGKTQKEEWVEVRRLLPARDDSLPVYVQEQGAILSKKGDMIDIRKDGSVIGTAKFLEISHVSIYGNVAVTTQALHELCNWAIPITYFSYGGWFYGITHGMSHKNIELRIRQFKVAGDSEMSLVIGKRIVEGKVRNCRTLLKRNNPECPDNALDELLRLSKLASEVTDSGVLLGIEGAAANVYFAHFSGMLKIGEGERLAAFDFKSRNRRPPTDPVNALLSFLYSLIVKDVTITLLSVGFDPYLGFYHRPKYGRPALALDMMEEFRPLIGDSVVLSLLNNKELTPDDFIRRGGAVAIKPEARKKVIEGYERRMDVSVTHPIFGYSLSYRRVLEVQARLLARFLAGEIPTYEPFCTR